MYLTNGGEVRANGPGLLISAGGQARTGINLEEVELRAQEKQQAKEQERLQKSGNPGIPD